MSSQVSASGVISQIVEQNLGVYRASPSRLQEDVSQEAQVASDYRGRLIYELLQNADDAMEGHAGHDDRVAFLVSDDALWMANTGRPLSDDDVRGLCGLGASSKVDSKGERRASIGHKGLGFKSVLEITERPAAFSTTHCLELGAVYARDPISSLWDELGLGMPDRVPAMRFPAPVDNIPDVWPTLRDEGYNTAFRFPFGDDVDAEQQQALAQDLLTLPLTTVLFLKNLERVEIRVDQSGQELRSSWRIERDRLEEGSWEPTVGITSGGMYRVAVTVDDSDGERFLLAHDDEVQIGQHRVGLSGPAWDNVELTEVSVAVLDTRQDPSTMPEAWRRFHVFLPTEQRCPYPFLVNGAFTTDLSRQHVHVSDDRHDYNAHLVREAARLFREELLGLLLERGTDLALASLQRRVGDDEAANAAAALLHRSLADELAAVPFLPDEQGRRRALPELALPPAQLGEEGVAFREVLVSEATWDGRSFPQPEYCRGRWSRVAADHGAVSLSAAEAVQALGQLIDDDRAVVRPHESGDFQLDPVLEVLQSLWRSADPADRETIEEAARDQRLFPVHRNPDDTLDRVTLATETAFYPPRSTKQDLPLARLKFMCHDLCWGDLLRQERAEILEDRMKAWTALFDIREFRFEEVMRAAVLPGLALEPDEEVRATLRDIETIAAICNLAGSLTKPDRPLRYQRLSGDRALFNLARLPLPCRSDNGEQRWEPAYKVYFGRDWIGAESVEEVIEAVDQGSEQQEHLSAAAFLAPPEQFIGHLGLDSDAEDGTSDDVPDAEADDEVSLEEDTDQILETDERERWTAFLSWIGVNRALRPIHFHDVEERAAGWLGTENLQQPDGWAFAELDGVWERFSNDMQRRLDEADHFEDDEVPYLYDVHDLDLIHPLLAAAEEQQEPQVGAALFAHLVHHWDFYQDFAEAELALVPQDKSPRMRTKPQRAKPEERRHIGPNLWLWRVQHSAFCPTTHGPRRPDRTWTGSREVERRFGRRGRDAGQLLPLLEVPPDLHTAGVRRLISRLGVRTDLSPSTFDLGDAKLLTEQLRTITTDEDGDVSVTTNQMREVVKPVYRQLFELLSGSIRGVIEEQPLSEAPLLAERDGERLFLSGPEILYAKNPGTRERSGVAGTVPLFVLEAEPAATAPLTNLFGVRTVEDVLAWNAEPGGPALDEGDIEEFRDGLRELLVPLLARIRVERSDPRDTRLLTELVERVEPIDELVLTASLDGEELHQAGDRRYFVSAPSGDESVRAYVLWDGDPWPPTPDESEALAMAMADLLGINLVETFLTFINVEDEQRRRLLDIAGASSYIHEIRDELEHGTSEDGDGLDPDEVEGFTKTRPEPTTTDGRAPVPPDPGEIAPAPPPVPLVDYDSLIIAGQPLKIMGQGAGNHTVTTRVGDADAPTGEGSSRTSLRAAPGVDTNELDGLGMRIAIAYELHRLTRDDRPADAIRSGSPLSQAIETLVVDVSTPAAIRHAEQHPVVKQLMLEVEQAGVSRAHPGCDLIAIEDGELRRLIELKSSAVNSRVQTMTWNEWKSAAKSDLRSRFWLYLVGNLRADLRDASPYVRAVKDPFGSLTSSEVHERRTQRAVQLRVREFDAAFHLDLEVVARSSTSDPGS